MAVPHSTPGASVALDSSAGGGDAGVDATAALRWIPGTSLVALAPLLLSRRASLRSPCVRRSPSRSRRCSDGVAATRRARRFGATRMSPPGPP